VRIAGLLRPGAWNLAADQTLTCPMRILIVEDEFLPAILLEGDLREAGWTTVGPYTTLAKAMSALDTEQFDLAVLDINLNGEMVYPLAEELRKREIPFIFLSGYTARDLPEEFRGLPRLSKPYNAALLRKEIERVSDS
jgi:two-component system, response regulator PdtaR